MKRKLKYFALAFTSSFVMLLGGCKGNSYDKVSLTFKDMSLTEMIKLETEDDVKEKIEWEENFVLVSSADKTCACWASFEQLVLNPYIEKTGVQIFYIDAENLVSGYFSLPISSSKSNTPVIGIYEDGKIKYKESYSYSNKIFSDLDAFTKYFEARVNLPTVEIISLDKFNELLKTDKKFLINYGLSICPDCKAYDRLFLKEYISKPTKRSIPYYYLETLAEGMRIKDGKYGTLEATAQWEAFKDNYGLSAVKNTEKGYSPGFVPTIQLIEGDGTDHVASEDITPIIKEMMVFQNDQATYTDGVVTITDSYYDGVRATSYLGEYESFIGNELSEEQYTYDEVKDEVKIVPLAVYEEHSKIAKIFLDKYWK